MSSPEQEDPVDHMATSGQERSTLLAPLAGALVLAFYAVIAMGAGTAMTTRRDVA